MASKRTSTLAPNLNTLFAKPGAAQARTTEIEDLPRSVEAPAEVVVEDRPKPEPEPPPPAPETKPEPVAEAKVEPVAETKPAAYSEQKPGKGIKAKTEGTTLYLLPDEAQRMRRLALDQRISLHDLILDGLDAILAKHGQRPINRYSKPRPKKQ